MILGWCQWSSPEVAQVKIRRQKHVFLILFCLKMGYCLFNWPPPPPLPPHVTTVLFFWLNQLKRAWCVGRGRRRWEEVRIEGENEVWGGEGTTSSGSGSRAYRRDSTLREKILSRRQHARKMDEHGGGENQTLRLWLGHTCSLIVLTGRKDCSWTLSLVVSIVAISNIKPILYIRIVNTSNFNIGMNINGTSITSKMQLCLNVVGHYVALACWSHSLWTIRKLILWTLLVNKNIPQGPWLSTMTLVIGTITCSGRVHQAVASPHWSDLAG